jgi:hypothetical protein
MNIKIYTILLLVCSIASHIQAQEGASQPLTMSVSVKKGKDDNTRDTFQEIQLRISHMSNRMMWLQQKLKEGDALENTLRAQFVTELSELIEKRGNLMQITRQMIQKQNAKVRVALF